MCHLYRPLSVYEIFNKGDNYPDTGGIGKAATEAEIKTLREQATLIGRVLRAKDAAVAGSAVKEGAVIITRDEKLIRFLNAVGIPASRF